MVRVGESVPVDGVIVRGETSLNESMITGEFTPVDKTIVIVYATEHLTKWE